MSIYAKSIAAVIVTVLSAILAATMGNGVIDATEWVNVAIAGVMACAVFAAPNIPGSAYTKSIIAVLLAGLTVMASAIVGGITYTEWIQIAVAAAGALGVYAAPKSGLY